jgi:hypothetical protein
MWGNPGVRRRFCERIETANGTVAMELLGV